MRDPMYADRGPEEAAIQSKYVCDGNQVGRKSPLDPWLQDLGVYNEGEGGGGEGSASS